MTIEKRTVTKINPSSWEEYQEDIFVDVVNETKETTITLDSIESQITQAESNRATIDTMIENLKSQRDEMLAL